MVANLTNQDYALKSLWPQKRVQNLVYQNQPFLAMVPKDTNFTGKNVVVAVRYADTQGRSATFATAQANKGANKGVAFTVTRKKDYALFSIDGETLLASKGQESTLVETLEAESSSAMHNIKRSLGISLYRSGSGSRGQSASTASPVTLVDTRDIVNFEVGMTITAGPNDSSTSLRSGTGVITAVDRDAGTITYTGTITSLTANDYLFVQGDESQMLSGLAAWLPSTAPDSTAFFGVDRSVDTVRLGGKRIDISSYSPSEGLVYAVNSLCKEGGTPNYMFCHFDQFSNIEHDLGSKVQYVDLGTAEVGFRGIKVNNPNGAPVTVLADINCPSNKAYMLQMDTWKLRTLGEAPRFLSADGSSILREASADSYEGRIGYYGNLTCEAPGWNAVITMPTL